MAAQYDKGQIVRLDAETGSFKEYQLPVNSNAVSRRIDPTSDLVRLRNHGYRRTPGSGYRQITEYPPPAVGNGMRELNNDPKEPCGSPLRETTLWLLISSEVGALEDARALRRPYSDPEVTRDPVGVEVELLALVTAEAVTHLKKTIPLVSHHQSHRMR